MSDFHMQTVGTSDGKALSRVLGWFSLGLGASGLLAPRPLARLIGVRPEGRAPAVLRMFGLRELAVGVGVLLRPRRSGPLWARVVGDALDISTLAVATLRRKGSRGRAAAALVGLAGVTAIDILAARRIGGRARTAPPPIVHAVTINRPPSEVYEFFRRLENLPLFMDYLDSVTVLDENRSVWIARLPVGGTIRWEATITQDLPGKLLAWRALGTGLEHEGIVRFDRAPGRDATELRVTMSLGIGGLRPNATLVKLLTRPQVKGDLRRLKQVLETGEVLFSDASAHRGPHPAQPSADASEHAAARAARSQKASEEGELR